MQAGKSYILYGRVRSKNLREATEYYICSRGGDILFYCDDGDKAAAPMKSIGEHPDAVVVILCTAVTQVYRKIRAMGFENEIFVAPLLGFRFICDAYESPKLLMESIYRWTHEYERKLRRLYVSNDAYTKKLLDRVLEERKEFHLLRVEDWMGNGKEAYFSDDVVSPSGDVTLVDGGAYVGDTIEELYRHFGDNLRMVYAFEPDAGNIREMVARIDNMGLRERIQYYPMGLSDQSGELRFSLVKDMLTLDSQGSVAISVCRLDDVVCDVDGKLCIKLDIEGSEVCAIKGAAETIKRYRPYMNVCVYHKMRDILDIPRTILSISDGYKFYLRSGYHTICCAVPE